MCTRTNCDQGSSVQNDPLAESMYFSEALPSFTSPTSLLDCHFIEMQVRPWRSLYPYN